MTITAVIKQLASVCGSLNIIKLHFHESLFIHLPLNTFFLQIHFGLYRAIENSVRQGQNHNCIVTSLQQTLWFKISVSFFWFCGLVESLFFYSFWPAIYLLLYIKNKSLSRCHNVTVSMETEFRLRKTEILYTAVYKSVDMNMCDLKVFKMQYHFHIFIYSIFSSTLKTVL